VWGSQTNKFPNAKDYSVFASDNLDVVEFKSHVSKPLKGDFYITVEAESLTTYTIVLITEHALVDVPSVMYRPTYI